MLWKRAETEVTRDTVCSFPWQRDSAQVPPSYRFTLMVVPGDLEAGPETHTVPDPGMLQCPRKEWSRQSGSVVCDTVVHHSRL